MVLEKKYEKNLITNFRLSSELKSVNEKKIRNQEILAEKGIELAELEKKLQITSQELFNQKNMFIAELESRKLEIKSLQLEYNKVLEQLRSSNLNNQEVYQLKNQNKQYLESIRLIKSEIVELSAQMQKIKNDKLTEMNHSLNQKKLIDSLKKELEIVILKNESLETSASDYAVSLNDLTLLLELEKKRNETLDKERQSLKKFLQISQKALNVNNLISDLKKD